MVHGLHVGHRKVWIEGADHRSDALRHVIGIGRSSNRHRAAGPRALRKGNVDLGETLALWPTVADILVDADDLPCDRWADVGDAGNQLVDRNALCQRVNIGEILFHHLRIDNRYGHSSGGIGFRESSSARNAYTERLKIFGRDHVEAGIRTLRFIRHRFACDLKAHAEACALDWETGRNRRGSDARKRLHSIAELAVESRYLLRSL